MRNQFVDTSNSKAFHKAMRALEMRGAAEACLMVVDGVPGLGKTTALQHWSARNQCLYARAKKKWRAAWMLNEILETMRLAPPHRFEDRYKLALGQIGQRLDRAQIDGQSFALVVDEADFICRNEECMETLRDVSDGLEVPIILVGMGKIRNNLRRFPQVMSRVAQYVEFKPATETDVRAFFDGICEVAVADDVVRFVHKFSKGYNREIKEAVAAVERFGHRNAPQDGATFSLRDLSGLQIMQDRDSGQPINVPEYA